MQPLPTMLGVVACVNCWKSFANGFNIVALRFGDHGTNEMSGVVGWRVWPVSNFAQQHPTTCNRVCKRTQHVTSNNVGSCWPTMLRPFARGLTHSVNLRRLQRSNTNLWSALGEFYRDCIFFDGLGICWTMLFTARNIFNTSERC